jgi:hypothetical protein
MLPVSLDYPFLIAASVFSNVYSLDILLFFIKYFFMIMCGNQEWIIQRNWQHSVHKAKTKYDRIQN